MAALKINAGDKENTNHQSIPLKTTATMKLKNISNDLIQEAFEIQQELESTEDQRGKDCDSDELLLDELPDFKNKCRKKEEPPCISPAALNDNDGEITYYNQVGDIKDKTWLPRYHQHHRIKQTLLHSKDSLHHYYKNPSCPKSRDGECDNMSIEDLSFHRYSRKLKTSNKIEIMCRLCRGENWIPKTKFNFHMAFSHGVLLPYNQHLRIAPALLPIPESLFISRTRKLTSFFVKCPDCQTWIKLGFKIDAKKIYNKNGLYHNYFTHSLKCHSTPNLNH